MKKMRKILSLLLVLAMVACLGVTAFADGETNNFTVTFYVQQAIRDADDNVTFNGDLLDNPITVPVESGKTLKDAILAACSAEDGLLADSVWNEKSPEFLTSLTVDGDVFANEDHYQYDVPSAGKATYTGKSWMYFDGEPADMPASSYTYPSTSLGQRTVTSNMTITLSYETLTFVWNYK